MTFLEAISLAIPVIGTVEGIRRHQKRRRLPLGTPDSYFDPRELAIGIRVEMEHTNDKRLAKQIAKDHLTEIPDYYTRLIEMERKAKQWK